MKTKAIISSVAGLALATSLVAPCAIPSDAHAATDTAASAQTLTVGALKAQSTSKTPTPRAIKFKSVWITFKNNQKTIQWSADSNKPTDAKYAWLCWTAPKKVSGLKSQSFTVQYADNSLMNGAKTKTTTKPYVLLPIDSASYVQVRTNAKYGKKAVHSKWASYHITSTTSSSITHYSDGTTYSYETGIISVIDRDGGKPGKTYAAALRCVPRALKLKNAKLTSPTKGKIAVAWKKSKVEPTYGDAHYAIRYSYSKSMKKAKTKELVSSPYIIRGLKAGKRVYVQVCAYRQDWNPFTGEWLDTYSQDSRWSAVKSIKMPS